MEYYVSYFLESDDRGRFPVEESLCADSDDEARARMARNRGEGHRLYREISLAPGVHFTVEQVATLCGGKLPEESGFDWSAVEYFMFEGGAFEPYAGMEILPGPSLRVSITPAL